MLFSNMFPGTYLKATDFDGGPKTLTIRSLTFEDIGGGEQKPVMHFTETQQGLVLNKTNGSSLAEDPNYGPETDNWIGKPVLVQAERTTFQGRPVMGIRIYPATMQAQPIQPGLPGVPPAAGYPPQPAPAQPVQVSQPAGMPPQPAQQPQPAPGQPVPVPQPAGMPPQPAQQPQPAPGQPAPGQPPAWSL